MKWETFSFRIWCSIYQMFDGNRLKTQCVMIPTLWSLLTQADVIMTTSGSSRAWRLHQMETFSALLALCAGNSPVTGEFSSQTPVTQSFDVLFDLRLNKRLSKQSWGWWFETPLCSLWRHCNGPLSWHHTKLASWQLSVFSVYYGMHWMLHVLPMMQYWHTSLKEKNRHFDAILIIGCTESCQNDNFQCNQWQKFHQNDHISISVIHVMHNTMEDLTKFTFSY